MQYTIRQVQLEVLTRFGEDSQASSPIPGPADIIALKVATLLPEVGGRILREVSVDMLGGGVEPEVEETTLKMPCGLYAIEVKLPGNYLRLVSVKVTGWARSAMRVILPGAPEWDCQWSEEAGIAGCPARPRAYLEGDVLRLVGTSEGSASLESLRVVTLPDGDSFDFPESLYPQLIVELYEKIVSCTG